MMILTTTLLIHLLHRSEVVVTSGSSHLIEYQLECMGTFGTANVYCNMTTDDGGWIVIQRIRINSQLSFIKNWREYEEGFGDLNKDFWAGLELMHILTQRGQWEMRVDYQKNDKTWSQLPPLQSVQCRNSEEYPLTVGGFIGVGSDRFANHNGIKFFTLDNDNDKRRIGNCAAAWKSAWMVVH